MTKKPLIIISGKVTRNTGRGRTLGFPTANLDSKIGTETEDGIYVGFCAIVPQRGRKAALVFIGVPETFGETERQIEVHILDFDEDLYGKNLTVKLIKKIRDNQRFDSEEALIAQMRRDEGAARAFFDKQVSARV